MGELVARLIGRSGESEIDALLSSILAEPAPPSRRELLLAGEVEPTAEELVGIKRSAVEAQAILDAGVEASALWRSQFTSPPDARRRALATVTRHLEDDVELWRVLAKRRT